MILSVTLSFVLQEYAKLQVTEPKVRTDMELVEQPADDLFPCLCHRTRVRDDTEFAVHQC